MKKEFIHTVKLPLLFVIVITSIHLYSSLNDIKLSHWGIYPRETKGLYGILSSVLIHGSWKHLFNNSTPLLVLGTALFYFYRKLAMKVCLYSIIFTGILVWLGGRPSFHIGASGLVYALASFLFFSGFLIFLDVGGAFMYGIPNELILPIYIIQLALVPVYLKRYKIGYIIGIGIALFVFLLQYYHHQLLIHHRFYFYTVQLHYIFLIPLVLYHNFYVIEKNLVLF